VEVAVLGWLQAVGLGLVEGITEYLPVSSTGHLILVASLLGLEHPDTHAALDTYLVVVQGGAILAVVGLYFSRVRSMVMGLLGRDPGGRKLVGHLLVAFAPAAVAGLLLGDTIDRLLFHPMPVLFALAVGGVFMIALGRRSTEARNASGTIDGMAWTTALGIGWWQTLALWPGTSRSMVTIAGAMLLGMRTAEAAEFSFLLGLPTLGAACLFKLRHGLVAGPHGEAPMLAQLGGTAVTTGIVVAAVSAALAVRWFVGLLTRRGLAPFGWYRLALTALLSALMFAGVVELSG
jgi:undecaprenyl-diphosphatase